MSSVTRRVVNCQRFKIQTSFQDAHYLLLQLKSFIFNVFHVVMTSIRWALEDEYDKADAIAVDSTDPTSREPSQMETDNPASRS